MAAGLDEIPLRSEAAKRLECGAFRRCLNQERLHFATTKRVLPPQRGITPDMAQIQAAPTDLNKRAGLVLDYNMVVSDDSIELTAGTWFVIDDTYLNSAYYDSGAIVKFYPGYFGGSPYGSEGQVV